MAPDMGKILEQIEKHDIESGIKESDAEFAQFQYANIWQMMCGTAHAHVVRISRSADSHMTIAVAAAVVATFGLLRATSVVTAPDLESLKNSIEIVGNKIIAILRGEEDLALDQITFTYVPPPDKSSSQ